MKELFESGYGKSCFGFTGSTQPQVAHGIACWFFLSDMFIPDTETQTMWFNKDSVTSVVEFELIGKVSVSFAVNSMCLHAFLIRVLIVISRLSAWLSTTASS